MNDVIISVSSVMPKNNYKVMFALYKNENITNNSTIIIHGHTDILGDKDYNLNLSQKSAEETQRILEMKLALKGIKGTKFKTTGFGEDESLAPFENKLPEERFYNRSVIIDIIPN